MMMGCRIAPYICQRTTDMISYLHQKNGYFLTNYVDDFLGIEYLSKVYRAHQMLKQLMSEVGAARSEKKLIAPTQCIEFIGNLVDTVSMTIGVTPQHKIETLKELDRWRYKKVTTRRQLESLVGKLQFISNRVKPGRLFISRILMLLKDMKCGEWYVLSEQVRQDIKWWYLYLPGFKGEGILWMLDIPKIDAEMAVDACLVGAGGVHHSECYKTEFPDHIKIGKGETNIAHLELWAVIIGIRLWGKELRGKIIKVKSDNEVVSTIINTGRSKDKKLQQLLRELVWWMSIHEMRIKTVHIFGKNNRLPDLLSRWTEGQAVQDEFFRKTSDNP